MLINHQVKNDMIIYNDMDSKVILYLCIAVFISKHGKCLKVRYT